eukprot:TRINITY_DN12499_c0_g2_i1.p1 TRINITY_DN12499_c0_g2~~TRINITY_DN12499_c0_g2_i1.p1  ORF type:complete len:154 (-),score=37.13 TRINITY_DN12499_c0_g2_i1:61-522(-)
MDSVVSTMSSAPPDPQPDEQDHAIATATESRSRSTSLALMQGQSQRASVSSGNPLLVSPVAHSVSSSGRTTPLTLSEAAAPAQISPARQASGSQSQLEREQLEKQLAAIAVVASTLPPRRSIVAAQGEQALKRSSTVERILQRVMQKPTGPEH